jgi:predicted nucleic acid-binding protein
VDRVVIDPAVLVSALITPQGNPAQLLAWMSMDAHVLLGQCGAQN